MKPPDSKHPLAWRVTMDGWQDMVTWADTAAKARWNVVHAYREAGYGRRGEWPAGVSASRYPLLDGSRHAEGYKRRVMKLQEAY